MREPAWLRTQRRVRSVACPRCGAGVDKPCRDLGSPHGRLLFGNRVHRERAERLRRFLA